LENGERLDQATFHERYKAMPAGVRAELIAGIVYVPAPQKRPHSRHQHNVHHWLGEYEVNTPRTEVLVNPTSILGEKSQPEPDGCLLILPESGGQTREDAEEFLVGPPELTVEIAWSTESLELHSKKTDYQKAGVCEYVVVALKTKRVFWFVRRRGKFKELPPGADGVFRSETFPGLWLDPAALLRRDMKRVLAVVRQGLATPEHAAFVAKLGQR
jgi:Uma2 family endonuclease